MNSLRKTPTPWMVTSYKKSYASEAYPGIISENGGSVVVPRVGPDSQGFDDFKNALHIVRCVNLHEELVEALRDSLPALEEAYSNATRSNAQFTLSILEKAKAVLAKVATAICLILTMTSCVHPIVPCTTDLDCERKNPGTEVEL